MLEVKGISAGYGNIEALHNVSLSVSYGQIVALLGANGAGKTTTLNCISSLVDVRRGGIQFEEEFIHNLGSDSVVARGISQVPETREVFAGMSVQENLSLGGHIRRDRRKIDKDLERVLDYFPQLRTRNRQLAGTLSGGEQQMLLIGRALMASPKLLLFDEPSLGLSPNMVDHIFDIIGQLNRDEGLTILLVEQNTRLALSVSEYAYVLENGEIMVEGTASELMHNDEIRRSYLGI